MDDDFDRSPVALDSVNKNEEFKGVLHFVSDSVSIPLTKNNTLGYVYVKKEATWQQKDAIRRVKEDAAREREEALRLVKLEGEKELEIAVKNERDEALRRYENELTQAVANVIQDRDDLLKATKDAATKEREEALRLARADAVQEQEGVIRQVKGEADRKHEEAIRLVERNAADQIEDMRNQLSQRQEVVDRVRLERDGAKHTIQQKIQLVEQVCRQREQERQDYISKQERLEKELERHKYSLERDASDSAEII